MFNLPFIFLTILTLLLSTIYGTECAIKNLLTHSLPHWNIGKNDAIYTRLALCIAILVLQTSKHTASRVNICTHLPIHTHRQVVSGTDVPVHMADADQCVPYPPQLLKTSNSSVNFKPRKYLLACICYTLIGTEFLFPRVLF